MDTMVNTCTACRQARVSPDNSIFFFCSCYGDALTCRHGNKKERKLNETP